MHRFRPVGTRWGHPVILPSRGGSVLPDMYDLQAIFDFLRQVLHVLAVLGREQDGFDSGTKSSNQFLLDAANSRNPSAKGNFALHRMMLC